MHSRNSLISNSSLLQRSSTNGCTLDHNYVRYDHQSYPNSRVNCNGFCEPSKVVHEKLHPRTASDSIATSKYVYCQSASAIQNSQDTRKDQAISIGPATNSGVQCNVFPTVTVAANRHTDCLSLHGDRSQLLSKKHAAGNDNLIPENHPSSTIRRQNVYNVDDVSTMSNQIMQNENERNFSPKDSSISNVEIDHCTEMFNTIREALIVADDVDDNVTSSVPYRMTEGLVSYL